MVPPCFDNQTHAQSSHSTALYRAQPGWTYYDLPRDRFTPPPHERPSTSFNRTGLSIADPAPCPSPLAYSSRSSASPQILAVPPTFCQLDPRSNLQLFTHRKAPDESPGPSFQLASRCTDRTNAYTERRYWHLRPRGAFAELTQFIPGAQQTPSQSQATFFTRPFLQVSPPPQVATHVTLPGKAVVPLGHAVQVALPATGANVFAGQS